MNCNLTILQCIKKRDKIDAKRGQQERPIWKNKRWKEPDDVGLSTFVSFRRLPLELDRTTRPRLDGVLELGSTAARTTTSHSFPGQLETINVIRSIMTSSNRLFQALKCDQPALKNCGNAIPVWSTIAATTDNDKRLTDAVFKGMKQDLAILDRDIRLLQLLQ